MSCNCNKCGKIATVIMLIVILVLNLCLLFQKDAWDLETLKVGGKENMAAIQEIYKTDAYKTAQAEAIDSTLEQIAAMTDTTDENTYEDENGGSNTTSQGSENIKAVVEDILANNPVRGNKDARYTIIEYTELHCPYCQRHAQAGTINAVMEAFPGEVNSVSRHYIIHGQSALELAAAMECIAELKPDVYYDAFEKAFDAYPVEMDGLKNIAVELGVNESDLNTCIDEWRYTKAVEDMMNQWAQLFGVSGTPGNVIIDRETGKYNVLPGAYPADNFIEMINSMKEAE